MTLKYSFKTAIKGLKGNRSRSILTILGIVIGITAIMIVMSLGAGAQELILGQIKTMGSKTIVIQPGKQPTGPNDALQALLSDSLKEKDLAELSKKSNLPHADRVEPLNVGAATSYYGNNLFRLSVYGTTQFIAKIYDITVDEGRFIDDNDVKNRADVVVIGSKIKEKLFGIDEAINKKIRIKDRTFKVIGVLPKKGQVSFLNFDEVAILPYTTAQQYVFGVKYFNHILVEVDSETNVDSTVRDIEITLRNDHGITDPVKDDFYVTTQAGAMKQVGTITNVLTLFLAAVAAISLLVGGVGIMNIMLVAVTERTREIGLRKAIGATDKDILTQFLLEAMILTALGGLVGIFLGTSFSYLASIVLTKFANLQWVFVFPVGAAFLGLGVSAGVGLIFGLYPARQAARKSPIEALRYE